MGAQQLIFQLIPDPTKLATKTKQYELGRCGSVSSPWQQQAVVRHWDQRAGLVLHIGSHLWTDIAPLV